MAKENKAVKSKQEPKTILGKPRNSSQSSEFRGPEKNIFSRIWHFLWKEDSFLSWIVSLALAFIIVKFIFFPLLSLVFATSLPLVVVESSSMHHPGSFVGNVMSLQDNFQLWWQEKGSWYTGRGITEQETENWPLKTGLEIGDIVLVTGHGKPEIGDIIIFNANQAHPIIHRIVNIENISGQTYYSTKGDNNEGQLISEKEIPSNALIGKAVLRIPKLGWLKLGFVKLFQAL